MDNLNLNSDESILHTTHTIVIAGVRYEAVLTSRRLIIVESETGTIREDLLFSAIGLAVAGSSQIREPELTLEINSPDKEIRTLELRFIRSLGIQNFPDRDKCIAILKEHNVPVRVNSRTVDSVPLSPGKGLIPGETDGEKPATRPAVPEFTLLKYQSQAQQPDLLEPKEHSPLITVAAIIIVIAAIIGGALIMGHGNNAATSTVLPAVTTAVLPAAVTTNPTPILTPENQVTSAPQPSGPPVFLVPPTGVWVRVQYPGNYVGGISVFGRNIAVNDTGTRYYQVPINYGPVDAFIEKQDGSADNLEIAVFQDGTLVSSSNTSKPLGTVDFHTRV
ncbi:MAG: hypothetical protein ABFC71_11660 [Methanoregula sp.]